MAPTESTPYVQSEKPGTRTPTRMLDCWAAGKTKTIESNPWKKIKGLSIFHWTNSQNIGGYRPGTVEKARFPRVDRFVVCIGVAIIDRISIIILPKNTKPLNKNNPLKTTKAQVPCVKKTHGKLILNSIHCTLRTAYLLTVGPYQTHSRNCHCQSPQFMRCLSSLTFTFGATNSPGSMGWKSSSSPFSKSCMAASALLKVWSPRTKDPRGRK